MDFAEQLKGQLDIVDVIQQYVRLKRQGTGARYVGLCPFHSEKTPSFGVNSTQQFYYCFGCQRSGDVFKFVQQIESLTFPETLKVLAERYGIPMPERQRSDNPEAQRYGALMEMHEIAATVFQDNLRSHAGSEARRYLESRGVSRAAMDEFRLGVSEEAGQQLTQRLQKFGPALMEDSSLFGKRDNGSFYDYFRGRLMFPVHDDSGKVVAFGARALRTGDSPKYLNSKETKIYKKSKVLYNLHRAKIDARKYDRMIMVEGYMDVIGVYSAGIREVIAVSGTALSIDQVRVVKRQISHQQASGGQVILNLDSDRAGLGATEKHIAPLLSEGLRVKVPTIPEGKDPDEYIRQNGADAYRKLLEQAPTYFHWLADRARGKFDLATAEGRADAFKFLWPTIQLVQDKIERSTIASELAEYLNIDREEIRRQFRRAPETQRASRREVSSAVPPNEKLLLACLLASEEARAAFRHYLTRVDFLHLLELRSTFETIAQFDEEAHPFSFEAISSRLEAREQRILAEIGFSEIGSMQEGATEQALHCIRELEAKAVNAKCEALRKRIREMERAGNLAEALQVAAELNGIKR